MSENEKSARARKSASPLQPGGKMFARLAELAFEVCDSYSREGGATVSQVAEELDASPEAARRFLDWGVEEGVLSKSPRPGEGATLYRRPSEYERALNTWLGEVRVALSGIFDDAYHVSIKESGVVVTLPLDRIPGLEGLAAVMPTRTEAEVAS